MSHFLNRLANRAMGLSPVVEPVRMPVFSAGPAVPPEPARSQSRDYRFGELVSPAPSSPPAVAETLATPQPTIVEPAVAPPTDISAPARSAEFGGPPLSPVTEAGFENRPAAVVPEQLPSGFDRSASDSGTTSGTTRSAEPSINARPVSAELSPLSVESVPSEPPPIRVEHQLFDGSVEPSDPPRFAKHSATPDTSLRPLPVSTPAIAAPDMVTQLPAEIPGLRPQAPAIKVNIGRIEVRAVTAPAEPAPRPKRNRPASLSLDDYLRERSGDRR